MSQRPWLELPRRAMSAKERDLARCQLDQGSNYLRDRHNSFFKQILGCLSPLVGRRRHRTSPPHIHILNLSTLVIPPEANLNLVTGLTNVYICIGYIKFCTRWRGTDRKSTSSIQKVPGYPGPQNTKTIFGERKKWVGVGVGGYRFKTRCFTHTDPT